MIEVDGHSHSNMLSAFLRKSEKPKVIVAHTVKGRGVSFMENQVLWHYRSPNNDQLQQALQEISNA